jgi:hypothetical protein
MAALWISAPQMHLSLGNSSLQHLSVVDLGHVYQQSSHTTCGIFAFSNATVSSLQRSRQKSQLTVHSLTECARRSSCRSNAAIFDSNGLTSASIIAIISAV